MASGVVLHVALAWPSLWSTVDDAWITARVAQNLVAGLGPVFSAGEPVEAYSDPEWMLLLAAALRLGLDPYPVMVFVGLAFGAIVPVLSAWLTSTLAGRFDLRAGAAALICGASMHLAIVATNGLETSTWIAAVVATCAASLSATTPRGWMVAGTLAGTLAWIRPEGPFVALAAACWALVVGRRNAIPFLASALPWVAGIQAWRAWNFGTLVANPVTAKASADWARVLRKNLAYVDLDLGLWEVVAVVVLASLALPGDRRRRLVPVVLAFLLLTGMVRVEEWMPGARLLVPMWVLGAAAWCSADVRRAWLIAPVLGAFGVLASPIGERARAYDERNTVLPGNQAGRAAAWLAEQVPAGTVAMRDAGVVAYHLGPGYRVDETHPQALSKPHPGGHPTRPARGAPDLLVTTLREPDAEDFVYKEDRMLFERREWRFLGRVEQHHRRYYDLWARPGSDLPELPPDLRLR